MIRKDEEDSEESQHGTGIRFPAATRHHEKEHAVENDIEGNNDYDDRDYMNQSRNDAFAEIVESFEQIFQTPPASHDAFEKSRRTDHTSSDPSGFPTAPHCQSGSPQNTCRQKASTDLGSGHSLPSRQTIGCTAPGCKCWSGGNVLHRLLPSSLVLCVSVPPDLPQPTCRWNQPLKLAFD